MIGNKWDSILNEEYNKEYFKNLIDFIKQEYKNKTPMIPFSERVAIVEAIKYVDKVVPQTSMDKFKAWEDLHFDVMFHGNDWKNSSLYNEIEEKFRGVGVAIEYFEYTKNTSSTKLQAAITKLNEQNN